MEAKKITKLTYDDPFSCGHEHPLLVKSS